MQDPNVNQHLSFPWYRQVLEGERIKVTNELAGLDPNSTPRLIHLQGQLKALLDIEKLFKKKLEEQMGIRV